MIALPTILSDRLLNLRLSLAGYHQTGVDLIATTNNGHLKAAGFSDDIGIYYFIPKIATVLHVSIDQAILIFFLSIIILGFAVGSLAALVLFRHPLTRLIALAGLLQIASYSLRTWDVYIVGAALASGLVLPALLLAHKKTIDWRWLLFCGVAGLAIGTGQYIRSHAGTGVLLFILIVLWVGMRATPWQRRLVATGGLIIGLIIPMIAASVLIHRRDAYLVHHEPTYQPVVAHHNFWHPVYLGFGYLSNNKGIAWDDGIAAAKVRSIDPSAAYLSERYNQILRDQILELGRSDPQFFYQTLFAKFGVMFYYLLLHANLSLLIRLFYRKPWPIETAFGMALGFSALFGIIVFPSPAYSLGFVALAIIYNIVTLNFAIEAGMLRTLASRIKHGGGK